MENNNNRKNNMNGNRDPKNNKTNGLVLMILSVVLLMSMYFMRNIRSDASEQEVPYSEFIQMVKKTRLI